MNRLLTTLKLTGTFALGVLTGVHFNFSLQTLRTLLALNSASQARRAFTISLGLLRSTVRPLELIAAASLLTAWLLSPRGGKHPYLLLATLPVAAAVGVERLKLVGVEYGVQTLGEGEVKEGERDGVKGEAEVNGEAVQGGMEAWKQWGLVRGGIVGVGFGIALVGVYGDFM
ncbi:hypothetical protein BZA05DRAFT_433916 [Tricharina praecox]|uniref:uncharacterized protein n=1 Tax=Tricharina praecox TaxID=43433 RepID=UPI00221F5952|nr:uncharacterized protein BZA05DRAFT_433916 [Tricharina praecox]KAI5856287.1 hypothetical protein BZA05DRAFT_433916 [Tricharina praecox]